MARKKHIDLVRDDDPAAAAEAAREVTANEVRVDVGTWVGKRDMESDPRGFLLLAVAEREVLDDDSGAPLTVLANGEGALGKSCLDLLDGLLGCRSQHQELSSGLTA